MVTCHMDSAQAYVWRLQNFVLGEHILKPSAENPTPVKVRLFFYLTIYYSSFPLTACVCVLQRRELFASFDKKDTF